MPRTLKRSRRDEVPYGECCMCGYVGTIKRHHIIPRRLKIKSNSKTTNFTIEIKRKDDNPKIRKEIINAHIEDIMIEVCENCHKRLHPEHVSCPDDLKELMRYRLGNGVKKEDFLRQIINDIWIGKGKVHKM